MIAALQRLNSLHPQPLSDKMAAFGIACASGDLQRAAARKASSSGAQSSKSSSANWA